MHSGKYESALKEARQAINKQIIYTADQAWADFREIIADDGDAKSFYGAVCAGLKKSTGEADPQVSEEMGSLALAIKAIIVSQAKRDWRDNVIVHREIKKRLDDLLFDFMEEHHLDWSLDTIDIIIDEIMMVAKRSY